MARRHLTHHDIPDDELVLIALLGNMAAFDELIRRYRGAIIRVAYQILASRAAAEDVAQDTFLLAFKALPQLQDPTNFAAWLCSIARHRARRVGSRDCKTEAVDRTELDRLILEHCPEMAMNPAEIVLNRCDNAIVPTALRSLPADHRIVMELRYYEEWPVARIAEFLSLPDSTVKWRLHMGREMMRRSLSDTYELEDKSGLPRETTNHERKRYGRKTHTTPAS